MEQISVGVVFVTTGGKKIVRAIESFRRMEPDLPIHVVVDDWSNTWRSNPTPPKEWFENQPGVKVRFFDNKYHINGTLNEGMRWMKELGHTHGCLFHDDLIFSPLEANRYFVSSWFDRLKAPDSSLKNTSGLGFGTLEVLYRNPGTVRYQPGHWDAPPEVWDAMDLESEEFWQKLCPGGQPVATVDFPTFFVDYTASGGLDGWCARLGPIGQIVPLSAWEAVGGFDEQYGVHYDSDYPAACFLKGLPRVLCLPKCPILHLHNQSIGYRDPSVGLWGNVSLAFEKKYGKEFGQFWTGRLGT